MISLRKSDVTVEEISVCNFIEDLMGHDINSLPFSNINDIRDLLS